MRTTLSAAARRHKGGRPGASFSTRSFIAIVALALVAAPLAIPQAAAAGKCSEAGRVSINGPWSSIHPPAFSAGGQTISAYLVAPLNPNAILVTNGRIVQLSTDGGCNWKETYDTAEQTSALPGVGSTTKILSFSMSDAVAGGAAVLALAEERVGNVVRPRVLRSGNGGRTFADSSTGIAPAGVPEALAVAPGDPRVAYVGIDIGGGTLDVLYGSADGGRTWEVRSDLSKGQQSVSGFVVDPVEATNIWAYGPTGVFHSTDGGRSFRAIPDFAGEAAGPIDLYRERGDKSGRIVVFRPGHDDLLASNDGRAWLSYGAPPGVSSATHGASSNSLLVSASGRVYTFAANASTWVDIKAAPSTIELTADRSKGDRYYGRTSSTIEVFVQPGGGSHKPPPGGGLGGVNVPPLPVPTDVSQDPAVLTGAKETVRLKPGESTTVRYALDLPKGERPLDLFFLVDTTDSMKRYVDALKLTFAEIVTQLTEEGIAANFGLGEYRAYPDFFPPRADEPNFVYRRLVDIGRDMGLMEDALQGLDDGGGGRFDAQLGALYQVATGEGQDLPPKEGNPNNDIGHDVPPGRNPKFRAAAQTGDQSLRIVINASNEPFGRPQSRSGNTDIVDSGSITAPEIPSIPRVAAALNEKGIMHIGLELDHVYGTRRDLDRMSTLTGAVAPAPGVDCDGDGSFDLAPGAPLVCGLGSDASAGSNLVPAIVSLVKSLPPKENPYLDVNTGEEVVTSVSPQSYDAVALDSGEALPFDVTFTCTESTAGAKYPVVLDALGDKGLLATADATVACAALPGQREKDKPPLLPPGIIPTFASPAVIVGLLPPLPPPAPPVPLTEISSATSSQAQSQAQAQAQAAAAAQKQEQTQLAYARSQHAQLEAAKEDEYQMSSFNKREPEMPPNVALMAAASAMAFAFGLASAHRRRTQVSRARRY